MDEQQVIVKMTKCSTVLDEQLIVKMTKCTTVLDEQQVIVKMTKCITVYGRTARRLVRRPSMG